MPKPRVFVTRIILEQGMQMIREFCDAEFWQDDLPPSREMLLDRVQGMHGLLPLINRQN